VLAGPGGHIVWLQLEGTMFQTAGPIEPGEWRLARQSGERLVLPATTVTVPFFTEPSDPIEINAR
jgi:hypothetical protein